MNPQTIIEFGNICTQIRNLLFQVTPVEYIAGKLVNPKQFKDNYMWISTADNEIGFAQCHYEIRLCEDLTPRHIEYVSVEVHIESSKSSISKSLDSNLSALSTVSKCNGTNYIWKTLGKKIPVDVSQVSNIIAELRTLDANVGKILKANIKQTLG